MINLVDLGVFLIQKVNMECTIIFFMKKEKKKKEGMEM